MWASFCSHFSTFHYKSLLNSEHILFKNIAYFERNFHLDLKFQKLQDSLAI